MIKFNQASNEIINNIISNWQQSHKPTYSNFFGLQTNYSYEIFESPHTIFVRKKEFDFHRIFILSDDEVELSLLLKKLDDTIYVFNLPTRNPIDNWDTLLVNSGFEYFDTFSKLSNPKIATMKKRPTSLNVYATREEAQEIMSLLFETFSPYTAHFPSMEELLQQIDDKKVFVDHYSDGRLCGVIICDVVGTTATASAWVDKGDNALDLQWDMYNSFIEKKAKRYVFWVRDTNKKVMKMHLRAGAVPIGVKDYTYVKEITKS